MKKQVFLVIATAVVTLAIVGIFRYFIMGGTKKEVATSEAATNQVAPTYVAATDDSFYNALIGPMVPVEGGTFQMGTPDNAKVRLSDETLHTVTVGSFQMQSIEVTQALYEAVMGNNPSSDKAWKDYPVTNVSWEDAVAFCEKLSSQTGRTFRLPTEAEWEYAARGGNRSRNYLYSGSNDLNAVGWHEENSGERLHVGREKQPNELGLYDMSGNVWEWCSDWYGPYRTDAVGSDNPKGPDNGQSRVLRGGSWNLDPQLCRVANRYRIPDFRFNYYGFRLVLVPVR